MRRAKSEEPTATVDEVRAGLNAEAEAVMNNSKPTPSQADMDKYMMGGHLDDKEESDPPVMLPVGVQQAMLAEAAPSTPPPVDPAATAPPVNRDVPLVMGDGIVGSTLNCTMGNWENEPTSYEYAWQTDGSPNSATGTNYNVVAGDAGKAISCVVTATNAAGSTAAPVSNAVNIEAVSEDTRRAAADHEARTVPKR